LQKSDWCSPHLSDGQLAYAAIDAIVTWQLWLKLRLDLVAKGRGDAYVLQRNVIPAVVRMIDRGVLIDRAVHAQQTATWSETHTKATEAFLTDSGRERPPNTPNEVRAYLSEVLPPVLLETWPRTSKGLLSIRAAQLRRFAYMPPIKSLLAISAAEKLLNVFGSELVNKISLITGRLHPSYNIAATKSGRTSSSRPNVQQIPKNRAPEFRKCIVAAPGTVLVVGDFNMMELRAAAAITDDAQMNEDFASGVDLHQQQAAAMLGIPYDEVTKEARDHAKPVNFSMIYGAGASGIVATAWNNYGVVLTLETAEAAKQAFLCRRATYANWMRTNYALSTHNGFITCGRYGRVIEAAWETPSATNGNGQHNPLSWSDEDEDDCEDYVEYYGNGSGWASDLLKYTLCCNAPIQGACADASMLALLKVDAALCEAKIIGGPVLFVHDEIVLEVPKDRAEEARRILEASMTDAFAEVFPTAPLNGVVSTGIGDSWGEAKT
jgi:DNA polymerase-1